MKIKILNGILIIDILSVLLILSIIYIPSTVARVILGLPLLIFFPGYTLVATLFVKKEGMNNLERIAISCVLSIAIVALIGLGLNYTSWGIRLGSVLYSVATFTFLMSVIALTVRARTLKANKFIIEFNLNLPKWKSNRFGTSLTIILIIAILGASGILGYFIATTDVGERFTEFYILGINKQAQDYPTNYIMNEGKVTQVVYTNGTLDTTSGLGIITLGIVNHERQTVVYYVKMTINDEIVNINLDKSITDILGPIELHRGEKWEKEIGIAPVHIGENQKVELLLFKSTETTPIDSLRVWINVKEVE